MITRNKQGYTLLETLIYTAILAAIIILVTTSAIYIFRFFGVVRIERRLSLEADTALETMVREIRNASSVDLSASAFNSNPGVLALNSATFSLSGGKLKISKDGQIDNLTNNVSVTNFIVYRAASNVSTLITIRMTLEAGNGALRRSHNYFASAVTRASY